MTLAELKEKLFYPASQYVQICNGFSGRGENKGHYHNHICNTIYDFLFPSNLPESWRKDYRGCEIREASTDITDCLDEQIGLPLERRLSEREIKIYTYKFINKLIENLDLFKKTVEQEESI
jgi:hypothetical protein